MIERHAYSGADHLAVIDVGSNSVRLVVFDGVTRSPQHMFNEKSMCGLGIGVAETGKLNPDGVTRAIAAMRRFRRIIDDMGLTHILAVATEAIRRADDGPAFRDRIAREFDIDLQVISGEEEARLSAQGVLMGRPDTTGLVCDIGGASMELAQIVKGEITKTRSSKLGPMSIAGQADEALFISSEIERLVAGYPVAPHKLYLVGGSWRAFATILIQRDDYPLRVIHEFAVDQDHLAAVLKDVIADPEMLNQFSGIAERRLALLPMAAQVLLALLERMKPKKILFSSYGLREGLLFDHMDDALRQCDPLLDAAMQEEQKHARFPGKGQQIFDWIAPLVAGASNKKTRLAQAACYFHDVYWASHPDYRADIAFDAVTHANLGGLGHKGRAFLAWCLLHRYKQRRISELYAQVQYLLTDEERVLAETVGQALRLAALLSFGPVNRLGQLELTDQALILTLAEDDEPLLGEAVTRRFEHLASHLGREAKLVFG